MVSADQECVNDVVPCAEEDTTDMWQFLQVQTDAIEEGFDSRIGEILTAPIKKSKIELIESRFTYRLIIFSGPLGQNIHDSLRITQNIA